MDDESFNESDTELEWPCFMRNSFLETLETLPQLWDPTHKHFKNRIKRSKAFEKLLDIHKQQNPNATKDIVRRKVQWILAYHRKILRKIVQAKEKGEEFKPRCQFKALQFLRKRKNYKNDSYDETYIQNKESNLEDSTDCNCTCGSRKAFIETLEQLPVLWDPCHIYYKHLKKRNEALNKLLKVERKFNPGASIDFVRRKVYWLISNYTRTYKQIEEARRNGETFKPKWQYQALKFLIKRMVLNDHSFREESDNSESYEYEYLDLSDDEVSTTTEYLEVSHKRKKIDIDCYSEPSKSIEPIALVWSEKLNGLEPTQRILAEKAINDILFEAELNNLQRVDTNT